MCSTGFFVFVLFFEINYKTKWEKSKHTIEILNQKIKELQGMLEEKDSMLYEMKQALEFGSKTMQTSLTEQQ